MLKRVGALMCAAALGIASQSPARAVEADSFLAATTGDMVALCSADANAPNYVAAVHFCHGFASGAFQYYQTAAAADASLRFVCLPNPQPTRSAAIADFLVWVQAKPDMMKAKPVDSMFRYLAERYPCAKAKK